MIVGEGAQIDYAHGFLRGFFRGRREDGKEEFGEIEMTCKGISLMS